MVFRAAPRTLAPNYQQKMYTFTGKVEVLVQAVVLKKEDYEKLIEEKRRELNKALELTAKVAIDELKEEIMRIFEDEIKEKGKIEGLEWLISEEDIKKYMEKKKK